MSLQFVYKINFQTPHVHIHSTPFLLQLEGLGLVCRAKGGCKRPRKGVGGGKNRHGVPEMGVKGLRLV